MTMADIKIQNVDALGKPLGQYSHLTRVKGASETLYIAGMLAPGEDFDSQCGGVFAATDTPHQVVMSKPLSPASSSVGKSGRKLDRLSVVVASARTLSDLMLGSALARLSNIRWMRPAIMSASAGAEPL